MGWVSTSSGEKTWVWKLGLLSNLCLIPFVAVLETSKVNTSSFCCVHVLNRVADWSLQSLFDRTIHKACPVAKTSEVLVSLPTDAIYAIKPEPTTIDGNLASFDVKASKWDGNFVFSLSFLL